MLEQVQICILLTTSLITAAMCVNSAQKSHDTTAFVSIGMVAFELENNFGISFHTIDG